MLLRATRALARLHRAPRPSCSSAILSRSLWTSSSNSTVAGNPLPKHTDHAWSPTTLAEHFDRPVSSSQSTSSSTLEPTGIFNQHLLKNPAGLHQAAQHVHQRAVLLLHRIHRAPEAGLGELRLVVKNFDRLSDLLCGIIDMCEVIWTVHPEGEWRNAAEEVYGGLCRLMNEMNVDTQLYGALKQAVETPSIAASFTPEERRTAQVFLHDFYKSGIHLEPASRAKFVNLSDRLINLGRQFTTSLSNPSSPAILPNAEMLRSGLGESFVRRVKPRFGRGGGKVKIQPGTWEAGMILTRAEDEEARKLVWMAGVKSEPERVELLEDLLRVRAETAGLVGKANWGEVDAEMKMAGGPDQVTSFLENLLRANRARMTSELRQLQLLKAKHLASSTTPSLQPWDREFYINQHQSQVVERAPALESLSPYFSVGTLMAGLSKLFDSLYGIRLEPASIAPGEVWHPGVRKLHVVDHADEAGAVIGTIYCDLFARQGKTGNAAHYTVRCSRRVDDDDLQGDLPPGQTDWTFDPRGGLNVQPAASRRREGLFQLPVVVLNCDFGEESNSSGGLTLLAWQEVETLFHEMGHAMHSMIGRTSLHNVSGTRVPTDLAEFPSIFMESFFSSPLILPSLVTHHSTGLPPPSSLVRAHRAQRTQFPSLETATQIHMALLDQRLHSITPSSDRSAVDSTKIYHDVTQKVDLIPSVPGTAPQAQFGHLHGYGSSYYAYLFDRAIAGRVWDQVFAQGGQGIDGLKEGGERMKRELLMWGGGRDPWEMVGGLLGDEEIKQGGKEAVEKVGRWGVSDER
ncbi:mitochondrial intermediate peptidase [Phaffia rhodozyma]|uniref:Mitochondrial intermediate peptidase 1 n=1 Tax=Phaffia rhodozyma TaxID=264483 RepID=A0A0F7SRR7_PHARH|nr:mitochondrial intermediate peptidase [Phaffia rhodozyma]